MAHAQIQEPVTISIRARKRQRDLIDQAAERLGRSRSDFMLEASCREAQDVLIDQTFFTVNAKTFKWFQDMMANPLPTTDALRRLLLTKAPWDK
ncbi:MAG: DUF1778 domain-containing protein [Alphaproteobacteria bacterium]|nr:DUF1778 domain-containing protein [Alphaproteobacteria bacterium]